MSEINELTDYMDCRDMSIISTVNLRRIAEQAQSENLKTVLLKQTDANKENVSYLQRNFLEVWVEEEGTKNSQEPYYSIFSGADGIITNRPDKVRKILKEIDKREKDSSLLFRSPAIIGYGGIPALAPENSIEGLNLALEKGIWAVEASVFLTKDGVPMVSHTNNLFALTGEDINVSDLTENEIVRLYITSGNTSQNAHCYVTRFKDFLSAIRGTHTIMYAFLSTNDDLLVSQCLELVSDLDIASQVIFRQGPSPMSKIYKNKNDTTAAILAGEKIVFTEVALEYNDVVDSIVPKSNSLNINTEAVLSTQAQAVLKNASGKIVDGKISIDIIGNSDCLKLSDDRTELTGVKYGIETAIYKYTGTLPGTDETYTIYSQPFTVSVNSNMRERIFIIGGIILGIIIIIVIIIMIIKRPKGPKFKPVPMSKD